MVKRRPFGFTAAGLLLTLCLGRGDVTVEGDYTVFRTGTNETLWTVRQPVTIPRFELQPKLVFDFGFATDEPILPQAFLDSFSATVQADDLSATAVLLTADAFGVSWAPPASGCLVLDPSALQHAAVGFADLQPALGHQEAFFVTYSLPEALAGRTVSLFLDFFDNTNDVPSLAYVTGLQVRSLPDTNQPTYLALESSSCIAGPFAEEPGVIVDAANQKFILPLRPLDRFFRLSADLRVRIARLILEGSDLRLRYAVEPADLVVEAASAITGPFAAVTVLGFDSEDQAVVLPKPSGMQFYRLKSLTPLEVVTLKVEADRLKLLYTAKPRAIQVLSSAQAAGPYAPESGVGWDPQQRQLTLERGGRTRFFRVRSDVSLRITAMVIRGDQIELSYDRF